MLIFLVFGWFFCEAFGQCQAMTSGDYFCLSRKWAGKWARSQACSSFTSPHVGGSNSSRSERSACLCHGSCGGVDKLAPRPPPNKLFNARARPAVIQLDDGPQDERKPRAAQPGQKCDPCDVCTQTRIYNTFLDKKIDKDAIWLGI